MEDRGGNDGRKAGGANAGGGPAEWLLHFKTAMFGSLHVIQKKVSTCDKAGAIAPNCSFRLPNERALFLALTRRVLRPKL
jgi:hypothetical protein